MPAKTKVTMGGAKEPEVVEEEVPVEEEAVEEVVEEEEDFVPTSIDDLDPAEELWESGPTVGQIQQWKQAYGDVYVTSISLDRHIVWRTIGRGEYRDHVKNMEQLIATGQLSQAEANLFNEEVIAETCILYPEYNHQSLQSELAGIPAIISQEVMEASGFMAVEVRQL